MQAQEVLRNVLTAIQRFQEETTNETPFVPPPRTARCLTAGRCCLFIGNDAMKHSMAASVWVVLCIALLITASPKKVYGQITYTVTVETTGIVYYGGPSGTGPGEIGTGSQNEPASGPVTTFGDNVTESMSAAGTRQEISAAYIKCDTTVNVSYLAPTAQNGGGYGSGDVLMDTMALKLSANIANANGGDSWIKNDSTSSFNGMSPLLSTWGSDLSLLRVTGATQANPQIEAFFPIGQNVSGSAMMEGYMMVSPNVNGPQTANLSFTISFQPQSPN